MRIITNADDFGQDDDTVAATIECFERGALTSATIMPHMPGTAKAVDFARRHPQFSFGLHLTFVRENENTPEAPLSPARDIPDLIDPDGRFPNSDSMRWRALMGRVPIDQIERETSAQIEALRNVGVKLSHIDSHGHLHKFKPFRTALRNVLPRFGITRVRGVQDIYLARPLRSPTYWLGGPWRRKLRALFKTTDHFFMPGSLDADWPARILGRVCGRAGGRVDGDTLEVGVHPGNNEPWRDVERRTVQAFATEARRADHQLIGWKDL